MSATIIGIAVVIITAVCVVCEKQRQKVFEERFPPLSDDEFMARCRPGTRPEIALKVRRTLSDCLGIDYERIYPESQLVRDLGAE